MSRGPARWLSLVVLLCSLTLGCLEPTAAAPSPLPATAAPGLDLDSFTTNAGDYPGGAVPRYARFELAFDITNTVATNPYFPYDASPPPGIAPGTGISVDAALLPPGETNWERALTLPCFYYQPVEDVGSGEDIALIPVGDPEWRCRFTPDRVGTWRYKVRATDAGGTTDSAAATFDCAPSDRKGFIGVSQTDSRFFAFADGTPFVTPLINIEQGSPFNTLARIRASIRSMGENGVRFVRWFPTGEGANYEVAPYADTMRINWRFGDGWTTTEHVDVAAGKLFSYRPYYYSSQSVLLAPGARYRLSFRAKVTGEQVLRAQVGGASGAHIDVCATGATVHPSTGETCTHRADDWQDYELIVEARDAASTVDVAVRGLYVSADAPAPYNSEQPGSISVHSVQFQRDETGSGDWGGNLLTRADPDTHGYVDQQAAARLDEILRQSETYGVYHKLTLFHKNDALLGRFLPDGTIGSWDLNNFYAGEDQSARWYEEAYARYFVARWSYSTALHSLELANENNFDTGALDAAFAIAAVIRETSPRLLLVSNSFWGWWVEDFWTDPERGHLMDYSDKHWYANESGASCDASGEHCELISNVWDDSAAYVRECALRFDAYRETFGYDKPIVRGEGGVAVETTEPQHPDIAQDPDGTYYHKKLWAHLGILGDTCDGEWYPRLFGGGDAGTFPNAEHDLARMFAAYEQFLAGEPLANGRHVEVGTDLTGDRGIEVDEGTGALRAWGVQDAGTGKTLLWIDNAADTWRAAVEGQTVAPASGTLTIRGFRPNTSYTAFAWDPYKLAASQPAVTMLAAPTSGPDGAITLTVGDLERDVAVKIYQVVRCYLPAVVREDS